MAESMDPFYISPSDHPGMTLTSTKFSGVNFIGWSRAIKMALGAKYKLGFIDGSCVKPANDSPNLQRWIRCNYMITCWILNSMESEFCEAFIYADNAYELWREINERFGHVSGPQIYQIQKELNDISQGNLSVAAYFTKMKRCWDEIQALDGLPICTCGKFNECTCGVLMKVSEIENRNRLMQFLMRLNNKFDAARSQILSMDPLPHVNKAYYLIQQIESQKNITRIQPEQSAFMVNKNRFPEKKDTKRFRTGERRFCKFCKSEGHTFEQCWERLGYPDWHKAKRDKKATSRFAGNVGADKENEAVQGNPLDIVHSGMHDSSHKNLDPSLMDALYNEMVKRFKAQSIDPAQGESMPLSSLNYAGPFN